MKNTILFVLVLSAFLSGCGSTKNIIENNKSSYVDDGGKSHVIGYSENVYDKLYQIDWNDEKSRGIVTVFTDDVTMVFDLIKDECGGDIVYINDRNETNMYDIKCGEK